MVQMVSRISASRVAGITEALAARLGRPPLVAEAAADHEVYLTEPDVLAAALALSWSGADRSG
jgi:hypothetical protein